jgi:hypothetical protein
MLLQRETESVSPMVTLAHLSSEEKHKVMKLAENVRYFNLLFLLNTNSMLLFAVDPCWSRILNSS